MAYSLSEKGNATLLVMMLAIGTSFAAMAFFTSVESYDSSLSVMIKQKESFYIAEGTRAIATSLTQDYLQSSQEPNSVELRTMLQTELPLYFPPTHEPQNIQAEFVDDPEMGIIPNGPFAGMLSSQTKVTFGYEIKSLRGLEYRSKTSVKVSTTLAHINAFQFMYFVDLDYADFVPDPPMSVEGYVHVNGDFCIGGTNGLVFSQISAAGRISHVDRHGGACFEHQSESGNVFIASGPGLLEPRRFEFNADHGCTNCGGTGLDWKDYSIQRWNGRLRDVAHGVPRLNLPVPEEVRAQLGVNGDPNFGHTNNRNMRFLLDPVLSDEPQDVSKQKYSYKADIRIIDGVWYLRNPANPGAWPGVPIWSDHPGSFTHLGQKVGQADLRAAWAATPYSWPLNSVPRRFSYYEYDAASSSIAQNAEGVISYGTLARLPPPPGGKPSWRPGFRMDNDGSRQSNLCRSSWSGPSSRPRVNGANAEERIYDAISAVVTCPNPGVSPTTASLLLNSTRSGFREPHLYTMYFPQTDRDLRSRMVPMNFDMRAFEEALSDTTPGELGSYFGPGRFMNQAFNGIVYVSLTWPGSELGYNPVGVSTLWPVQGQVRDWVPNDNTYIDVTAAEQQQALPVNLCSEATSAIAPPGTPFDGTRRFTIPDCADYQGVSARVPAYPNAVRIINGANLNHAIFPKGISVVSNQMVYLLGDFNSNSDTSTVSSTPWLPAMIGADWFTVMSNAWEDQNSNWLTFPTPDLASDSTYNLSLLTGWARYNSSVPMHTIPVLVEDWSRSRLNFNGSIVVGFYPVYFRASARYLPGRTYRAGVRELRFDPHLARPAMQPPGTPIFSLNQVIDWKVQ